MSHTSLKQLPPTLREKKRYLVFEAISHRGSIPLAKAAKAIALSYANLHGEKGSADSGLQFVSKRSRDELQRGMIRVNRKHVLDLKAAIALVKTVDNQDVVLRSIGLSGMIKKAEEKFMAS